MLPERKTPGVYREEVFLASPAELPTGRPAFLGLIQRKEAEAHSGSFSLHPRPTPNVWLVKKSGADSGEVPEAFTRLTEFEDTFGELKPYGYLAHAVRGFFENEGRQCWVRVICWDESASATAALEEGLKTLEALEEIDLVCAPDIMCPREGGKLPPDPDEVWRMQSRLLKHCDDLGYLFAILDSMPEARPDQMQDRQGLRGKNGALYYPWVKVAEGPEATSGFVPPCGHLAGVYARTDQQTGVHKAPANEVLEGVLDLKTRLNDAQQGELNPRGINCLRAFPGRGIRVWGARTLSDESAWSYVNVRRLFLTAGRWMVRNISGVVFEPNGPPLWARISRDLTAYFNDLFLRGALQGQTAQEAFYIKCDGETNPPEVREAGRVISEIGLAPALPNEFVVVRIIQDAGGVTITGPTRPG